MSTTEWHEEEAAVVQVESAWDTAWKSGDIAALLACLEADAVLVNPHGQTITGHAAISRELTAVLRSFNGRSKHVSSISRVSFVTADVAVVDGEARITIGDRDEPENTLSHRFTDILVKQDERWLIAHIRASPISR